MASLQEPAVPPAPPAPAGRRVVADGLTVPEDAGSHFVYYNTVVYYTILYYTILCYAMLYYTILYYTILYHIILFCSSILYYRHIV